MAFLTVAAALCLDEVLGEPRRFHPLNGFGLWANWLEAQLNRGTRLFGVLALGLALSPLLLLSPVFDTLGIWADVLVLYLCIGYKSLREHVNTVKEALLSADINTARAKLGLIVSRDTQELSADECAQANIETLLENSLDTIFASIFWFLIGGATAVLLHRWVNTLDALWGYKNARFKYFGWAAAHLDDVLNFIPARILALLMLIVGNSKQAVYCWRNQAKHCASPNAGVVICTGAGALGIRLSERANYQGVWHKKSTMGVGEGATAFDIPKAMELIAKCMGLLLLILFFKDVLV